MTKNKWDERYTNREYVYGTAPNEFIKSVLPHNQTCEVLAIAEGEGRNAVYAAELGHNVTAWDLSSVGLKKMHELATLRGVNVKTKVVDLSKDITWPKTQWEVVINVFGHIGDASIRQHVYQGIQETLKPGGMYMMEVYSNRQIPYKSGGPADAQLLYDPHEVLNAFEDWNILHFYYGEAVRNEGILHSGKGHVIQMLAQKPIGVNA